MRKDVLCSKTHAHRLTLLNGVGTTKEEAARNGGLNVKQMNIEANKGKGVTAYLEKRRETNPSHGTFFGMSEKEASPKPVGKLVRK